jgi:uncharacterized protein (TIGR03086 family)
MTNSGGLQVTTPGDRAIAMARVFDAPGQLVFDAWTKPELLTRWLGVFGDWSMDVCEVDPRVGGTYRFVWHGAGGATMGMRGVYREVVAPERLVSTERFDDPWYAGEAVATTVTTTVLYASKEVRDAVLRTPMDKGVAAKLRPACRVADMSEGRETIAGRYRQRADAFERKVAAARPEQWSNQSPCTEWTARDVVRHIVEMHGVMLRPLGRALSPAPSVDDDPLGAFKAARADVEAVLATPAEAEHEFDFFGRRITVEQSVDQVVSADLVIHGWDLARATGQDETIDPAELHGGLSQIEGLDESVLRQPGVLGPALAPPPDADEQTRLLAFLGRKAW